MATTFVSAPARAIVSPRVAPVRAQIGGGTVTYYFRRTDGTRGNATSIGSIPAGAVVERIVTA